MRQSKAACADGEAATHEGGDEAAQFTCATLKLSYPFNIGQLLLRQADAIVLFLQTVGDYGAEDAANLAFRDVLEKSGVFFLWRARASSASRLEISSASIFGKGCIGSGLFHCHGTYIAIFHGVYPVEQESIFTPRKRA